MASGRRKLGAALLIRFVITMAILAAIVHWASDGRAVESWRACMFAGTGPGDLLGSLMGGEFLRVTRYSRLLIALLVVAIAAFVAAYVVSSRSRAADARRSLWLPAGVFLGSSLSTGIALSSPGTVPSNQMVEWIVIVLFVLVFVASTQSRLTRVVTLVAALLVIWMAAQDVASAQKLWRQRPVAAEAVERSRLVARVAAAPGPVLSESAIWPVLAHREIYLLDPFAIRVVMQSRKDIERDLSDKIERQLFPMIIFQFDPASPAARGYYENVSFGRAITERILERYQLESRPVSEAFVYVPRQP